MKPNVPLQVQVPSGLIDQVPVGNVMSCLKEHAKVVRRTKAPRCKEDVAVVVTRYPVRANSRSCCLQIRTQTGKTTVTLSRVRPVRRARR